MTTTTKCLLEAKYAEDVQTTQYTSPTGTRAMIDQMLAYSAAGGTITVNLVASGGAAGASNLFVSKTLAANETAILVAGQTLNAGDFISTDTAAASTVTIRISGRELT